MPTLQRQGLGRKEVVKMAKKMTIQDVYSLCSWPQEVYPALSVLFYMMIDSGCNNHTIKNFFVNLHSNPEYFKKSSHRYVNIAASTLVKYRKVG